MILEVALALAGSASAYLLLVQRQRRSSSRKPEARAEGNARSVERSSAGRSRPERVAHGLLAEGEVVGIGDSEYWLTEACWLYEDEQPVAAVYRAEDRHLVVLPASPPRVYLGQAVSLDLAPEFPALLEVAAQGFTLESTIPVRVHAGGATQVADGRWARYDGGPDEVLWILRSTHLNLCLSTRSVPERFIFRWGRASE